MKYLKLFEDSENIYGIKRNLEYILLEVRDMGYYTNVVINPYLDEVGIYISMNPTIGDHTRVFKVDDLVNIGDTIMRIYDYMFGYYGDPFNVVIYASSINPRTIPHTAFNADSSYNWSVISPFDRIKITFISKKRKELIKFFQSGNESFI
jgi:hypothetical protein